MYPDGPGQLCGPVFSGPEDPHIYMNSVGDPGPFRGRKRSLYEGGVRMPFIARWPGTVPAGRVSSQGVTSADWLPTVAALAGVEMHDHGIMGHDVSGALVPARGPPTQRAVPRMWDYRADGYGYCWNQAPRLAIRDWVHPELKLLMNVDGSRLEVYNLSQATFEATSSVAVPHVDVARMSQRLMQWYRTLPPSPMKARHLGCLAYAFPRAASPAGEAATWDPTEGLDPYAV